MTATPIPWDERVENFTRHLLHAKAGTIVPVQGRPGRGKTRLLRDVASRLVNQSRIPLYLSPPQGEEDTAGAALAAAVDKLNVHTLLNGQTATFKDLHVSREEKIRIVVEAMRRASNSMVLLLDEPARWASGEWSATYSAAAGRFARQVGKDLATQSGCRVVYTGSNFGVGSEEEPYHLPKAWNEADLPRALTDCPAWQDIRGSLGGAVGDQATPLLFRLLTMLSILTTPGEAVEAGRTCLGVDQLATLVEERSANRPQLRRVWACLALVRTSIDQKLYEQLASGLDHELQFITEELLLTRIEGGYELHPLLARAIDSKMVLGSEYREVHKQLTRFYLGDQASLAYATEAFFHATEMGEEDLAAQVQPFFIEQLHLRGRSLSWQKKHREAAEIFRQAQELDPADDYAHHYCAFNLDWIAEDQPTIERGYQKALELNPCHPWWHSRWINYLITVGKTTAARAAFANATDHLQEALEFDRDYVYRSLHSWVAALLLHRGQLEFARQVLERVPVKVRRDHRGFCALEEKLAALEEARRGRGVFPLSVPASQHWRKSPHLDFPPHVEGKQLLAWHPARVEDVSEQGVTLIVGKPSGGGSPPTYGRINLSPEQFDTATLDERTADLRPGRFLELAFYGDEGILKIRSHPQEAWEDPDLPYLTPPDTLRYLRKQEQSS
jgi:tetratricopeptide (TPR) repeat protein